MIPGMAKPTDGLYRDLDDLPHAVRIAWHEAQADPDGAADILARLAADIKRVSQVAAIHLREASERATKRENAAEKATYRAERRIATALAGLVATPLGDELDPHGLYVYLLWGSDPGCPLYVGQSTNLFVRLGNHMGERGKRSQVRRISAIRCKTVDQMNRTEWRLIQHYQPPLNTMGIRPANVKEPIAPVRRRRAPKETA